VLVFVFFSYLLLCGFARALLLLAFDAEGCFLGSVDEGRCRLVVELVTSSTENKSAGLP